jgi:hypothetical protein
MTAAEITAVEMTSVEETRLIELEAIVEAGKKTFVAVGNALAEINTEQLYRCTHDSFEAYVKDRFGISRSFAYRAIEGARVADVLSPMGDTLNERQARELAGLPAADVVEVFQRAVDATSGKPTARAIRQARLPLPPAPSKPSTPSRRNSSRGGTAMTSYRDPIHFVSVVTGYTASGLAVEQFKTLDWTQITTDAAMLANEKVDRMLALLTEVKARLEAVSTSVAAGSSPRQPITILAGRNTAKCGYEWAVSDAIKRLGIQAMPDVANRNSGLRAFPSKHMHDLVACLEADGHNVRVVTE